VKKILDVHIGELTSVQVWCPTCKSVIGMALNRLEEASLTCPGCRETLRTAGVDKAIGQFVASLRYLQTNGFQMGFRLPCDE
jgi:hypothetical protein